MCLLPELSIRHRSSQADDNSNIESSGVADEHGLITAAACIFETWRAGHAEQPPDARGLDTLDQTVLTGSCITLNGRRPYEVATSLFRTSLRPMCRCIINFVTPSDLWAHGIY